MFCNKCKSRTRGWEKLLSYKCPNCRERINVDYNCHICGYSERQYNCPYCEYNLKTDPIYSLKSKYSIIKYYIPQNIILTIIILLIVLYFFYRDVTRPRHAHFGGYGFN